MNVFSAHRAAHTLFQLSDEFILFLCDEIANVSLCNTLSGSSLQRAEEPDSEVCCFHKHTAIAVETNRYVLSQQDVTSICRSVHAEGQCLCLTSAAVHPNAAGAFI